MAKPARGLSEEVAKAVFIGGAVLVWGSALYVALYAALKTLS